MKETPRETANTDTDTAKRRQKEGSLLTSQKLLLTWLADDPALIPKVGRYIGPEDFREPVYHRTAQLLFDEYNATKTVTPARIVNQFDDKEEQSLVAALFNTTIRDDSDPAVREKALNETVLKIKKSSIEYRSKNAKDIQTLQSVIKEKAALKTLHISL